MRLQAASLLRGRAGRVLRLVGRLARDQGVAVYVVGGAVRDLLLGKPNLDLDVTVLGDAMALAEQTAHELNGQLVLHGQLGTATVLAGDGLRIDLATARKEHYPGPGMLPRVSPGTLEEDLLRRDFTVNTLALRLDQDFGRLVDFCGGVRDLSRRLIRVLHERSFQDDPTRVLRAARLAETRSFRLAPATRKLVVHALRSGALDTLSDARLRDQLVLTLDDAAVVGMVKRLNSLGFWRALHPGLRADAKAARIMSAVADLRARLESPPPCGWWLLHLLALARDLSAREGSALAARLHLHAPEREALVQTLRLRKRLARRLSVSAVAPSRVWLMLRRVPLAVPIFLAASLPARNEARARVVRFLLDHRHAKPLLGGADLLRLGVPKSPVLGRLLERLTVAQLDGIVHTQAEAVAWIRRKLAGSRKVN